MQLTAIRSLVFLYLSFFLWLSIRVVYESFETDNWTANDIGPHSVLIGITALSGWFSQILSLINFLLGFGGGLFARPPANETHSSRIFRIILLIWAAGLIVMSLWALWALADASARIPGSVSDLARMMSSETVSTKPAIEALGLLNASIIAGFLAGLAVPDVRKVE